MKEFSIPIPKGNKPQVKKDYSVLHYNYNIDNYRIALHGLKRAAESKILVVGCVRNIDNSVLSHNLNRLSDIMAMFADYHIYLYENDSTPQHKAELLKHKSDHISIQSETIKVPLLGGGRDYNRVYCMAMCRNKYVDFFHKNDNYDYVMVFDFDLYDFRADGIFHSLGLDNWDMMGANGLQETEGKLVYYDVFALVEKDYKTYADGEARNTPAVNSRLHPVFSCFGGIGLYTKQAFIAGERYSVPIFDGRMQSEHCSFALNMNMNNHTNIFVNPNMVAIR